MTPLLAALPGALIVGGFILLWMSLQPVPDRQGAPRTAPVSRRLGSISIRTRRLGLISLAIGVAVWLFTGWAIAVLVVPALVIGLPTLLSAPAGTVQIEKLEAMEEWTRSLAGVLIVGTGIEQALEATLRSTPDAIREPVTRLIARIRGRWSTREALEAFCDELDDETGDVIAANLILGSNRRSSRLGEVLNGLAGSVAANVRNRRQVEADRAKPRSTARWVTLITVGVLIVFSLTGDYIAPYRSPIGTALAAVYLAAYIAILVWMRRMAAGKPGPRFMGEKARQS